MTQGIGTEQSVPILTGVSGFYRSLCGISPQLRRFTWEGSDVRLPLFARRCFTWLKR
ncbi:hypothetical protein [Paenibacillus campi]|uniref:hypothetical protein n=1 Tax=Paenibacillus campi TaxID=3106031 RepID=UPI002AFF6798|nr:MULTISPECIES: hypothetical protein [unclassified Paenibacillus]